MKILNIEISDHFNQIRKDVEKLYSLPIKYESIEKIGIGGFGAIDNFSSSNYATVYLSTKLSGSIFESNLLHEILHLEQIEKHYPTIETYSKEDLKKEIGSNFQSTILDLGVMKKMRQLGYSSTYFIIERYKTLKNLANHNYDLVVSEDHKTLITINISLMLLTYKKQYNDYLLTRLEKVFPTVKENATKITNIINKNGYDNPEKCCQNYKDILSLLDLWKDHYINFHGDLITSP